MRSERQCHPGSAAGEKKAWQKRKQGMLRTGHASCIAFAVAANLTSLQLRPPALAFHQARDKHHRPHAHRLSNLRVASHCCFPGHDFTFSLPTNIQRVVSFAFDLASRRAFTPSGRSSKVPRGVQHKQLEPLGRSTRYEQTNPYLSICGTSSKFLS